MLKQTILGTLVIGLLLVGCGDSKDSDDKDAGGGTAGTTGNAGTTAGTNGTSGTGAGSGGAGTQGTSDGGIQLDCDTTIAAEAACGGTTCTELDQSAKDMCQVTCCTDDDKCGTKNTSTQAGQFGFGNCMLPAVEDPRCANVSQFGDPCCTADGNCGISLQGSACFDPSSFGQGTPVKCDEAGNDDDAGM